MTLKEIAKLAGVSAATVSYVLNDSAPISPQTKERVLKIVEETGYISNNIAKSLRGNKTELIGIIAEDITVPQTSAIIDGISESAEAKGYSTILSNLRFLSKLHSKFESIVDYKGDITDALNMLMRMRVDGVIYIGMHDRNLKDIIEPKIKPIVYCYCYSDDEEDVSVSYDNKNISYELTKRFIEKGHKRIGLITGAADSYPAHERLMGYLEAIEEAGIRFDLDYVKNGNWSYDKGKKAAMELLTMSPAPTAVYAMSDPMAIGVYEAALSLGLSIPGDVSVIGFDNAECIHYLNPRMSTVNIPLKEMGSRSIDYLIRMIDGDTIEKKKICLPCQLILRDSIANL